MDIRGKSRTTVQLFSRAGRAYPVGPVNGEFLGEMVLPGMASSVPLLRRFVGDALTAAHHQSVDGAQLVTSELATNAVVHSRSGWPGGLVTADVITFGDGLARIEVTDEGGTTLPRPCNPDDGDCHGRGLRLVEQLAQQWGVRLDARGWKTVWANVPTTEDAPIGPADMSSYMDELLP
ncbi:MULTISPECIES: ATP-binding protein [unclassified Nonomuraea]|uniref:ATP-binding protein n=1 Tax=unclassified Nonomuraea TaxID=2593643 RepID=UPI0013766B29|nr:ATP-binding protein [Nonomuraea sp. KC401]NBE91862.1 ATP-binding protein [Nonomuraea sp. K271]